MLSTTTRSLLYGGGGSSLLRFRYTVHGSVAAGATHEFCYGSTFSKEKNCESLSPTSTRRLYRSAVNMQNIIPMAAKLCKKLAFALQNLNLFPSVPPSDDEHELRQERISTRLFILLLFLSLTVLLLYTSLVYVTQTVSVQVPTRADYDHLYARQADKLICPCAQIAVDYQKFLRVEYKLHPVCTSPFIDAPWIAHLARAYGDATVFVYDFRWTSSNTFQVLKTACDLSNMTLFNRIQRFYSTQYISASVTPLHIFRLQISSQISEFMASMASEFYLSLISIQRTAESNGLLSAKKTNYNLVRSTRVNDTFVYVQPLMYGNCSCALSNLCLYPSTMVEYNTRKVLFIVPGMYTGCYLVVALMSSDLRCLYNQTCIDEMQSHFLSKPPVNISALDSSLLIRSTERSTINTLLDVLMVEQWDSSVIYEGYFNECRPAVCTYVQQARHQALYIMTTLIGLLGGLITVLRLTVPYMVAFTFYCLHKLARMRSTVMTTVSN